MNYDDRAYHRMRERHCRTMAELANDPEIRRRHEELATLHAYRAGIRLARSSGELSAI